MSRKTLIVVSSALVALTAAAGAGSIAFAKTPSPAAVTLHASDLKGFKLQRSEVLNNAQMAKLVRVPKAQFDAHGRITGLQEQFGLKNGSVLPVVGANVYAYKTAAGAAWDYSKSSAFDLRGRHKLSVSGLGAAAVGFSTTAKSGKQQIQEIGIDFHRGNYDVTVVLANLQGNASLSSDKAYARIIDNRIKSGK